MIHSLRAIATCAAFASVLTGLAATLALTSSTRAQTAFADKSTAWGVLCRHVDTSFTQTMGGGVAFFDYDGDGDEDLFVTSSNGAHRLFEHTGTSFVDRTAGSGLDQTPQSHTLGVIAGDYNQDGLPDLYLTNNGPNHLFTNLGSGKFREDSAALGVRGNAWSVSAAWADFDRDGDLDLYVGDYVDLMNFPYHIGFPNKLYVNLGAAATPRFVDQAKKLGVQGAGVFGPPSPTFPFPVSNPQIVQGSATFGCTLSVCTQDFDDDGDQDILVGNDFGEFVVPNLLYRNDTPDGGVLKFTDISVASGFANNPHYNMGINGADYDHDGDWDFYLSNLGENVFHQNRNGYFVDVAAAAGPLEGWNDAKTHRLSAWGTIFCDFDNDLWEDLIVVNGFINGALQNLNDPNSTNHLWMNQGNATFKRFDPAGSGMADTGAGRGVAASDVNHDGLMDFYLMNNGGLSVASAGDRCRLFVNQGNFGGSKNSWSQLRLHGWLSNREAIGARVVAEVGGQVLERQVLADPVYLSSGTRLVHFGFGRNAEAERITIDWPSRIHQELVGVPADRRFQIHEPKITIEGVEEPKWEHGAMWWSARVQNRTNQYLITNGAWQLRLGKGGPEITTLSQAAVLGPHETAVIRSSVPLSPSLRAAVVGLDIEQSVYIVADKAVDSRRQVDKLK